MGEIPTFPNPNLPFIDVRRLRSPLFPQFLAGLPIYEKKGVTSPWGQDPRSLYLIHVLLIWPFSTNMSCSLFGCALNM